MSRMVSFKADDMEEQEIDDYMKARHLKSLPELSRNALFAYMRQSKPGKHGTRKHTADALKIDSDGGGGYPPRLVAAEGAK